MKKTKRERIKGRLTGWQTEKNIAAYTVFDCDSDSRVGANA